MIGKDSKRGTWYVQIRCRDPLDNKMHIRKKRGFKTKREAKLAEAEMMKEPAPSGSMTFRAISEQYLESIQAGDEAKQMHRTRFEKSFAYLYDLPINSITKPALIEWRSSLIASPYAYNTQKRTLQYVRSVFHYASQIYDVPDQSIVLKPIKKPIETESPMHVWTVEQFDQFLSAVDNPLYALFFETLFWTGMRRGEAIALQKTDLKGNELYIHGSMKHFVNGIKPPKNSASIRTIRLDDALVCDLQPLLKADGDYLFGGETSLPISCIQRQFEKAIERSGVPKIRIHDLRHSHATILINAGVNIVAVSKRLGHATIEQTLKTYTHLLRQTDDQMMEVIDKLHEQTDK